MLIELGYSCGPTVNDGCTGPSTTSAIEAFQSDYALDVDGIAGPATTSKLEDLTENGSGTYSSENRHVQEMLIQLGYSCGSSGADGWYGPSTISAVANFQRDYALTVDGIAGPETVSKLEELTSGGGSEGGSPSITPVSGDVNSDNKDSSPHPPCDSQNRCYEEVYYNQCDSRWKNVMYSDQNSASHTICTSGCGPTSMAMVVATLKDRSITPQTPAAYAVEHGMKDDDVGTYWSFFCSYAKKVGLKCEQVDCTNSKMSYIKSKINGGALGIAAVGPGQWTKGGHFISVNSFDGNYIWAHDPNYSSGKSAKQSISQFVEECTQFWILYN